MNRILVLISLAEGAIEKIKANPELAKKEMDFVRQWQGEGILESFFITASKTGAMLIFKNTDEVKAKSLIEILPYFPFMAKIEYYNVDKHF